MKKLTKRALCALISVLMLLGTIGTVSFASEEKKSIFTYGEDDLVIADFSKAGTREDVVYWRGDDAYSSVKGTYFRDMTEITDEVSLNGRTALKMDHRYYRTANDVKEYYNKRVQRNFGLITDPLAEYPEDKQTKIFYTVDDVLKYDYLYMWIYSGKANNQSVNIQINDLATSEYAGNLVIKMDYSGWKLHKINISSWELSSFNNTRDGQEATATLTDNIRFNLQTSGWNAEAKADTVLYIDSIWLSNNAQTYKTDYDENDYLIGDFTAIGGASTMSGQIMKDCTEVTRDGRETSVRLSPADGAEGRLIIPQTHKIGEILEYDNLYFWVYSSVANNQQMYVILFDKTSDNYLSYTFKYNWVGWKRIKIGKDDWNNSYELASFNKNKTDENGNPYVNYAKADDIAYMWFVTTWNKTPYLADTKLYFDSIWFSDKNLNDGETYSPQANEWEKDGGYLIADFSSDTSDVASWATFKYAHKDNITDEITRNGKSKALKWTEMGDGTDKINSKLESPKKQNLGDVLNYDYLYLWIYSEKANNQDLNVVLTDVTANHNGLATKVKMDYVGWKLHKVDISNLTLAKFDDPGTDDKALAKPAPANTDEWKLLLQCSGWSVKPLADTTLYMDTIWLSNVDYYDINEEMIKDFNDSTASVNGTFKNISGSTKKKTASSVDTYGNSTYSAEVIPSQDNYTFATTQLYNNSTGITLDNETLKDKYLNIIINAVDAETQKIRINFDGKMADGSTTMRVYKILNGIEPGWQILSLPLADFTKQNGGSSTEEILNGAGVLNSVDLHFPDWGNGRENVTYREITEGETGTHIYNEETKKYEAVSGGTGTHVIANTYHNGSTHWDNIGSKISSDAKYYVDSVFLSNKDMSGEYAFTALNTLTEEVPLDGFKAVFEAPYILSSGADTYKNDITVTKNGTAVSSDEYIVNTDGKRLIVEFNNRLDSNSNYEIKVAEGLTMANGLETTADCVLNISTLTKYASFTYPMDITNSGKVTFTSAAAWENTSATVEAVPDNFVALSASTVINNTSEADVSLSMILAVYDSNNQLVGMFKGNDVTIEKGVAGTVTATVTGEFANCTAKAFLWDMSVDAMIPYSAVAPLN
ncbi:MAG: hypothetical protein IJC74_00940 [Clostridia bacterium]|nr:hypothetical protein [Clostridia bacterium]